eukprot:TRINITY_DN1635_c0_g1_i1.p1 TRINITY_DN1635_c0_g1~~TRINITY_DN1635_c0_g1_i1.p1  ORF type:complete len:642 (+),score=120.86 TRINITY_DN1635_c0_g1_i1:150-2075(+)
MNMESTIVSINKDGDILSVDKTASKMFGFTLEEMIGQPVNIIIPAPYKEQHATYIHNYLSSGRAKIIGKSRTLEAQHKNGCVFPIRLSVSKVGKGDSITFIGIIEQVQQSQAVVTTDSSGNIISCNQVTEELFGFKPSEMVDQNIQLLCPRENSVRGQTVHDLINKQSLGQVRNLFFKRKDGTDFPSSARVETIGMGAVQLYRARIDCVDQIQSTLTLTQDGTILATDEFFMMALFGYDKLELVGQSISVVVPELVNSTGSSGSFIRTTTKDQEEGDVCQPKAKRQKLPIDWRTSGAHYFVAAHKDGSTFPVCFEIFQLLAPTGSPSQTSTTTLTDIAASPLSSYGEIDGSCSSSDSLPSTMAKYCVSIRRVTQAYDSTKVPKRRTLGNYVVEKTIGQGSYGKVKVATHKDTGDRFAVKILRKDRIQDLDRVRREIDIMKEVDHPNIVKLIEVIETEEDINLVMELGERSLGKLIANGPLSEVEARRYFEQIANAVKYCHQRGVIHRDLKLDNVMLDKEGNCKLIDFGLSNFMETGKMRSTFCGTPAYAPPEMILGKRYTGPEVDVWSLGIVLFHLVQGTLPFKDIAEVISGSYHPSKEISAELLDLLSHMHRVEPSERFSIAQVLQHPWCAAPSELDVRL